MDSQLSTGRQKVAIHVNTIDTLETDLFFMIEIIIPCFHQPYRIESEKNILSMIFSIFFSIPTLVGGALFRDQGGYLKNSNSIQSDLYISQPAGNFKL